MPSPWLDPVAHSQTRSDFTSTERLMMYSSALEGAAMSGLETNAVLLCREI
jgi:hypothetical protein